DSSNGLSIRQIKARLSPYLPQGENWKNWWASIKKRFKKDGRIAGPIGGDKHYCLSISSATQARPVVDNFLKAPDLHTRFKEALAVLKSGDKSKEDLSE